MQYVASSLLASSLLLGIGQALPERHSVNRRTQASQPYVAPGPNDARAPCPALNTLANHGYINHDGRDLERQDIINAFQDQFGIAESAIDLALTNAFTVCSYTTGTDCGTTLKNLTILAEPHAFEHDHSFSRKDYGQFGAPWGQSYTNNQNFDLSTFETSLDVVSGSTHVNYSQMNEIRLKRESLALQNDKPGWFVEQKPIQEFEAGFIFAVMGDFDLPDYNTTPKIRKEWWEYWFINESFPYPLGWHPPTSARGSDFILSASAAVLAAPVTSTPWPLPAGAFSSAPPPATLDEANATTTYEIPTNTPYVAPGFSGTEANYKRAEATTTATPATTAAPSFKNPYMETLAISDIAAQQAYVSAAMASASS